MPLIDRSYFVGELNIPNTDRPEIQERLDLFIETYETELLRDLLGYPLYKAFMNGLQGAPVDQKWTNLLEGVEYTDQSDRLTKWRGLVSLPLDLVNAIDASNTITIVVGRGTLIDGQSGLLLDPIIGTNSVPLPSSLIGKDFIVEQRGVGQLSSDEWSITGDNRLQLASGQFGDGDKYFYKAATLSLNTVTGNAKKSLIANYVYWHWMADQVSQTVGLGEAATKAENATMVSPAAKMHRAWNEMIRWVEEMVCYLDTKRSIYPEWQDMNRYKFSRQFTTTNTFGI
jgi:hypothetical protein